VTASPGFTLSLDLQVGKYEIQQLLGKGATGTVYLAKDTFSGNLVALKTIEPEVFRDPEFGKVHRAQFLNEASLAGKLRHPHIAAILDAVVEKNSGYIAMELVTGGELTQFAAPDKLLPVADVLQIGFKCCGALEYAFKEGIVHRDIKPANIMVVKGTDVKISDFGAAYLRTTQMVQTAAMGSPFYMAPEQLTGEPVTFHSDMYALGVVIYELLTGARPVHADSLEALIQKIVAEEPAPPSALRQGIPPAVDAVVLRALKKLPAERYPNWGAFAEELSGAGQLMLSAVEIPDSEKFVSLKQVPMLAALSEAEIWELVNAGSWSRATAKRAIIKENDPGASLIFIARGEAKVIRGGRLLNLIKEGEFVGEMAYIRGGEVPRHATIESMTELLLAEFEQAALEKMSLGAQLHLMRALVRNLGDRLAFSNARAVPQAAAKESGAA
jgi:serine/threonine protein kinase